MNTEKQIEEMAKIIQEGELARNRGDIDCSEFPTDLVIKVGLQRLAGAKALYTADYRKASEVARNIFGNLRILGYIDFDGNFCIRKDSFEELEKIYTESEDKKCSDTQ